MNDLNCKPEGIIFPRQSNNLHHSHASFKNYPLEEIMKTMKLDIFLILFTVDYLKEVLIPETNKILKHPMELG